jgi:hypothetical protein
MPGNFLIMQCAVLKGISSILLSNQPCQDHFFKYLNLNCSPPPLPFYNHINSLNTNLLENKFIPWNRNLKVEKWLEREILMEGEIKNEKMKKSWGTNL